MLNATSTPFSINWIVGCKPAVPTIAFTAISISSKGILLEALSPYISLIFFCSQYLIKPCDKSILLMATKAGLNNFICSNKRSLLELQLNPITL